MAPTRRTVVRAAAWSAPAVTLATAAPAMASSYSRRLTFQPGASSLVSQVVGGQRYFSLQFVGASVLASGGSIPAAGLTLTASFEPVAGSAANLLVRPASVESSWNSSTAPDSVAEVIVLTYAQSVPTGGIAELTTRSFSVNGDLGSFGPALPQSQQQGRVVLTFTAEGFAPAVHTFEVPQAVIFNPGNTVVSNGEFTSFWGIDFRGASVTLPAHVEPSQLTMTVTLTPDPPYTVNEVRTINEGPRGWTQVPRNQNFTSLPYSYLNAAGPGRLSIPDGMYFIGGGIPQFLRGKFLLTFSAPGMSDTVYTFYEPVRGPLVFTPGSTVVRAMSPATNLWGLDFQGAWLDVPGGVDADQLIMTVTFEPDPGSTINSLRTTSTPVPSGWTGPPAFASGRKLVYSKPAQTGPGRLDIPNGVYFTYNNATDPRQAGRFVLTFTAPGLVDAEYKVGLLR